MTDKPNHPLAEFSIATYAGANLTFAGLLGWAANIIQVWTVKNGLIIIASLAVISSIAHVVHWFLYLRRLSNYYKFEGENIAQRLGGELETSKTQANLDLAEERARGNELESRLEKLIIEFRSRSHINPRPTKLNAYVCTRKIKMATESLIFGIKGVTRQLIIIDKGENHGLSYGMEFAIHKAGEGACIGFANIELIESDTAWLAHGGLIEGDAILPDELDLRLVYPQDITDAEKEMARILLIGDGFDLLDTV